MTLSAKNEKALQDVIKSIIDKNKDFDTLPLDEFLARRIAATERFIENFSPPYPVLIQQSPRYAQFKADHEEKVIKGHGMISAYKDVLERLNSNK